jgi:hypothetical protein
VVPGGAASVLTDNIPVTGFLAFGFVIAWVIEELDH